LKPVEAGPQLAILRRGNRSLSEVAGRVVVKYERGRGGRGGLGSGRCSGTGWFDGSYRAGMVGWRAVTQMEDTELSRNASPRGMAAGTCWTARPGEAVFGSWRTRADPGGAAGALASGLVGEIVVSAGDDRTRGMRGGGAGSIRWGCRSSWRGYMWALAERQRADLTAHDV